MTKNQQFKIALIKKGLSKKQIAEKLGVTPAYLHIILQRMDEGVNHLMPKSSTTDKAQRLINRLIEEEVNELSVK